jgi:hypothetical protein
VHLRLDEFPRLITWLYSWVAQKVTLTLFRQGYGGFFVSKIGRYDDDPARLRYRRVDSPALKGVF